MGEAGMERPFLDKPGIGINRLRTKMRNPFGVNNTNNARTECPIGIRVGKRNVKMNKDIVFLPILRL
jgi:hypothetical protein